MPYCAGGGIISLFQESADQTLMELFRFILVDIVYKVNEIALESFNPAAVWLNLQEGFIQEFPGILNV